MHRSLTSPQPEIQPPWAPGPLATGGGTWRLKPHVAALAPCCRARVVGTELGPKTCMVKGIGAEPLPQMFKAVLKRGEAEPWPGSRLRTRMPCYTLRAHSIPLPCSSGPGYHQGGCYKEQHRLQRPPPALQHIPTPCCSSAPFSHPLVLFSPHH